MKHIQLAILFISVAFFSCKKNFLERNPQTSVTQNEFFKSPADLETYTNGLYDILPGTNSNMDLYTDIYSDNISTYTGASQTDIMIRGDLSPATVNGWDTLEWGQLRKINFMLDNVDKTQGDPIAISHYVGIARFFRGYFYYQMVKKYGDVPWYSTTISSKDEALLNKAKDPRTLVVDSIMSDLEFASQNILPDGSNTRITKWTALAMLARVALNEGTYRTYHTELSLSGTAQAFLQKAVDATATIMNEGGFSIYKTSGGAQDFRTLFSSTSLEGNPEVIFLRRTSRSDDIHNNTHYVLDWQWALSRSLEEEFLMKDGTPFTSQPNYNTRNFVQVFSNRDPRMGETIMPPGFTEFPPDGSPYVIKPNFGGYLQVKFYPRDPAQRGGNDDTYTDIPVMRYAEVLLINAEAKAELGAISQGDLDNTIGLLRERVNMPALDMSYANAHVDARLSAEYPNVTGANKGVLLEIRRERRVEMACEGLRFDDLYRWKVGDLLAAPSEGIYVPGLGAMDVTGDGVNDIAILQSPNDLGPIAGLSPSEQNRLNKYYLDGAVFYLSNGTSGFVRFTKDQLQPKSFSDKYYYFPIPLQQTLLNPNLTQPPGW